MKLVLMLAMTKFLDLGIGAKTLVFWEKGVQNTYVLRQVSQNAHALGYGFHNGYDLGHGLVEL